MKSKVQVYDRRQQKPGAYTEQYSITSSRQENQIFTPITSHFKEFLLEHTESYRKTERFKTADKTTRMAFTRQIKKNSFYRKMLSVSLNKDSLQDDLAKIRQKIEIGKTDPKDNYPSVFREIWENQQKKKFQMNLSRKGVTSFTSSDNKNGKGMAEEVKSFENFLEIKKKHERAKSWQQADPGSFNALTSGRKDETLQIAGNHQQLRKKPIVKPKGDKKTAAKGRFIKKNTVVAKIQQTQQNIEKVQPKVQKQHQQQDLRQKQEISVDRKQELKDQAVSLVQNPEGPIQIEKDEKTLGVCLGAQKKVQTCLKNFFSPFNGIQIKYLSADNQDSFTSIKKLSLKRPVQPVRSIRPSVHSIFKRHQGPIVDARSIVFRSKSTTKQYEPPCIDGWKVQHDQVQQFNDFYEHQ